MKKYIIFTSVLDLKPHANLNEISWDLDEHKILVDSYHQVFHVLKRSARLLIPASHMHECDLQVTESVNKKKPELTIQLVLFMSSNNDMLHTSLPSSIINTLHEATGEAASILHKLCESDRPELIKISHSAQEHTGENVFTAPSLISTEIAQFLRNLKNRDHDVTLSSQTNCNITIPQINEQPLKFSDENETVDLDIWIHSISYDLVAEIEAVQTTESRNSRKRLYFADHDHSRLAQAHADRMAINITVTRNYKTKHGAKEVDSYDLKKINSVFKPKTRQSSLW